MQIEGEFRRGEFAPPSGYAYFCSTCGRVWARVVVTARPFSVWSLTCEKCPRSHSLEVAGSLFLSWERPFNDSLPREVLLREFEIGYENWKREEECLESSGSGL